jgi:hypothetical protein
VTTHPPATSTHAQAASSNAASARSWRLRSWTPRCASFNGVFCKQVAGLRHRLELRDRGRR